MEKRNTLFCYTISEEMNTDIEILARQKNVAQAEFVRQCFQAAIRNKKAMKKLLTHISKSELRVIGGQKKKLIYLSQTEYRQLMDIRRETKVPMGVILRTGVEICKDHVLKKNF